MAWTGLKPHELSNPAAYVVEADLRELRGLRTTALAEIKSWRRRDAELARQAVTPLTPLMPVSWLLMALLSPLRGLRPGEDGAGSQLAARAWGTLAAYSERHICNGWAELAAQGLAHRRPRDVEHAWEGTRQFQRADICSVAYLTPKGVARLEAVNGKARRLIVRIGHHHSRSLPAHGVIWRVLHKLLGKIAGVAARLSPLKLRFRPTAVKRSGKREKLTAERSSPVGNASERGPPKRKPAPRSPGANSALAGVGDDRARIEQLFQRGELTPANAYPEVWRPLKKFEPRTRHHWWLIRCYRELLAELAWLSEPSTLQLELAAKWTKTWPKPKRADPNDGIIRSGVQ